MLKLDEAFHSFVGKQNYPELLRAGMTAVDLGAAPGGWTWFLTQHKIKVVAIDNGPLADHLYDSNLVTHLKTDAFKYLPDVTIDWLVAAIADKPSNVIDLIADWVSNDLATHIIFIIKLPMKKRYEFLKNNVIRQLNNFIRINPERRLFIKHLSHDRNEITIGLI